MAKKKHSTKEKMANKKPTPEEMWTHLCNEHEVAQKNVSVATRKAFIKGMLQDAHVAELNKSFDAVKAVKKKMKKFLKKHA